MDDYDEQCCAFANHALILSPLMLRLKDYLRIANWVNAVFSEKKTSIFKLYLGSPKHRHPGDSSIPSRRGFVISYSKARLAYLRAENFLVQSILVEKGTPNAKSSAILTSTPVLCLLFCDGRRYRTNTVKTRKVRQNGAYVETLSKLKEFLLREYSLFLLEKCVYPRIPL